MRSASKSSSEQVIPVDPPLVDPGSRRPDNADESVPEALVPDVVRADVQRSAPETPQSRWTRIARRAYELAQQRGFAPGAELGDWLQAEKEVDEDEQRKQAQPENQLTG